MPDNNVLFRIGAWEQYSSLAAKDPNTLYFVVDATHQEIWKGDELFARGTVVTDTLAGLMTPEQKKALESLIDSGGTVADLPTYELEKQSTTDNGAIATYKLKKTVGESVSYVGDAINIPADRVLTEGSLKYSSANDNPYPGAVKGDPYLDLVLNDESASHIYIPVKGLVDTITAGDGISVISNIVSIKLDTANTHGLRVGEAGLALDLATETSDGAMSAEDKKALSVIPAKYLQRLFEVVDSTDPKPIVKYNDGEIRIMFGADTAWVSQQVGAGGDPNSYYTNFKAYAPEGAAKFREFSDAKINLMPTDTPMEVFEGNSSAGMDAFGRKYTNVWLPVAVKNDSGVWSYHGDRSSLNHYVGWYYGVEWYDADDNLLGSNVIRINLSNAACHSNPLPYYMSEYALKTDLDQVSGTIQWGAIE